MKRMIKIQDVGKLMEKLKSLRKGGKDKDQSEEKEEEPKRNETEKQEVNTQETDKNMQQTIKSDPAFEEELEDAKDGLKPLEVKEVDGDTIRPTPTPSNTETNEGGSDTYRGRMPWDDSSYQEPDAGNESNSDSFDMEEEGMEI